MGINNSKNKILERVPKYVRKLFTKKEINKIKLINYKNKFVDLDNNIINISVEEVSAPIMLGIDKLNRPFIVFRLKFISKNNKDKEVMITNIYYQKYDNLEKPWIMSTNYLYEYLISEMITKKEELYQIRKLIIDKKIENNKYFIILC